MKNKKMIGTFLAATSLALGLSVSTTQVHAEKYYWIRNYSYSARPYHAKDPQASVAVWNWNHTHKLHDLINFPHTTWYATSSVTMRHGSTKAVYYKVISGNKKHSGYIWRGFLTKGAYVYSDDTDGSIDVHDPAEKYYDPVPPVTYTGKKYIDSSLNNQLSALFTGAEPDKQVQLAADLANRNGDHLSTSLQKLQNDILGTENSANIIKIVNNTKYEGTTAGLLQFEKEQINQQLAAQGKTISDFANYKVGSYVFPSNNKNYGRFIVFLSPKDAVLPKLGDVYYDPIDTGIAIPANLIDNNLNNQIADLFPGTIKDSQVQFGANLASVAFQEGDATSERDYVLDHIVGKGNHDNYFESVERYTGSPDGLVEFEKEQLKYKLALRGKTFSDFKGYKIGAYVVPQSKNEFESRQYGEVLVVLVPPKAKLPAVPPKHTFNVNDVN
ncbi:hypothetical protein SAMN04487792_0221 [Lactobacillus bombicola]|uniref:D-alanyl-D-alanine carboxypeptidase n=1 Tax=Lactobacillus bombicola TaxID=1505723 RepID=A0A1I1R800_9LACO|nr:MULTISPECIES: hypothetical protein [Lactobacillus]MCO6528109.1 hypothetical protein [Lactobacillus sp.]RMC46481.1 hypothetical protein F5ESL0230_04275 [Lactobacillus sp. ESL0230]SFD30372.1 hypothetical protein SAMN04487792_0221 [Lactobacillus bombicola]